MLLDVETVEKIDAVFGEAEAEGRRSLREPDVYRILEALGQDTPRHVFVDDPAKVDGALLAPFHGNAIVKIVSPDIAHKSKLGGVRKVPTGEPLYVRFVLESMRGEVLDHFAAGTEKPLIDGFLIAELIPFTQAIGNEVLIGVKKRRGVRAGDHLIGRAATTRSSSHAGTIRRICHSRLFPGKTHRRSPIL